MTPHTLSGPTANCLVIMLPLSLGTIARAWKKKCRISALLADVSSLIGVMLSNLGERTNRMVCLGCRLPRGDHQVLAGLA
jgi:hypothetical protein